MCKFNFLFGLCVVLLLGCTPDYIQTDIMLAEDGDAKAQCRLGDCYYNGKGVFKNLSKAVVWYTKSAKQGDADAQLKLGICFLNGQGVTRDAKLAAEWFEKSADQENADAQIELGRCYEYGYGIEKNYVKAVDLYAKAYKNGRKTYLEYEAEKNNNRYAQYKLAKCIFTGEETVKWYLKSAEQGYVKAQSEIATWYSLGGLGFPKDPEKATFWRLKAAENGDAACQAIIGEYYFFGHKGFPQDYKKAVEWFLKSIQYRKEEDNIYVYYYLGVCYADGLGVSEDKKEAFAYFSKSAKLGYADAQYALALCYENDYDFEKSNYWMKRAADQGHEKAKSYLQTLNYLKNKFKD